MPINYSICQRCVMDISDSEINFDLHGICDHCRTFDNDIKPVWKPNEERWAEIQSLADDIKLAGSGKDFDCILGMSGGVDSSYLVYLATVKLGLRPLVFHVDAGWNSQQAVNNI